MTIQISKSRISDVVDKLNPTALLMSIVHRTGDLSVLRGSLRRTTQSPLAQGAGAELIDGFSREDAEKIRKMAEEAFADGTDAARELTVAEIDEMVQFIAGLTYPADITAVCRDLASGGAPKAAEVPGAAEFPVAIIGGGQGGIAAAVRLQQLGIPYVLFEKNTGVGGTWFENTYPGVRVDVPAHTYDLSYAPNHEWSSYFALGDEIRRYYQDVSDKLGVSDHIQFGCEVTSAIYDEASGNWTLTVRSAQGTQQHTFRAVISAVGQLNRPRWPEIEGLSSFKGKLVHSAMWPQDLDLTGLRVGIIGSAPQRFRSSRKRSERLPTPLSCSVPRRGCITIPFMRTKSAMLKSGRCARCHTIPTGIASRCCTPGSKGHTRKPGLIPIGPSPALSAP